VVAQSPNLLQRISLLKDYATGNESFWASPRNPELDDAIQLAERSQHDSFAAWAQNEKSTALIGLGRYEDALCRSTCLRRTPPAKQPRPSRAVRTQHSSWPMQVWANLPKPGEKLKLLEREYNERNPIIFVLV